MVVVHGIAWRAARLWWLLEVVRLPTVFGLAPWHSFVLWGGVDAAVLESLPFNKQANFAWRVCSSPVPPPSCSHVAALEGEFSPDSFAYGGVFSPDASYMSGGGAGASSTGVTVVHTDPTQHPAYVS